jgi:hypothetical protein
MFRDSCEWAISRRLKIHPRRPAARKAEWCSVGVSCFPLLFGRPLCNCKHYKSPRWLVPLRPRRGAPRVPASPPIPRSPGRDQIREASPRVLAGIPRLPTRAVSRASERSRQPGSARAPRRSEQRRPRRIGRASRSTIGEASSRHRGKRCPRCQRRCSTERGATRQFSCLFSFDPPQENAQGQTAV